MIEAKSLRIGNIVQYTETYEGVKNVIHAPVESISENLIILENGIHHEYTCGIPLTEEWLRRFGAKKFSNDWNVHGVILHTRKRGYSLRKSVKDVVYVHELQNLIFALKGVELVLPAPGIEASTPQRSEEFKGVKERSVYPPNRHE